MTVYNTYKGFQMHKHIWMYKLSWDFRNTFLWESFSSDSLRNRQDRQTSTRSRNRCLFSFSFSTFLTRHCSTYFFSLFFFLPPLIKITHPIALSILSLYWGICLPHFPQWCHKFSFSLPLVFTPIMQEHCKLRGLLLPPHILYTSICRLFLWGESSVCSPPYCVIWLIKRLGVGQELWVIQLDALSWGKQVPQRDKHYQR